MSELTKKLAIIQSELVAPKNQYNSFGKYYFRNCEDILEGLKPILKKTETTLVLHDEIILVGDRHYIQATATLSDGTDKIEASAYAREPKEQKGMSDSQLTGSASSYARKYALNGLFCIDDTKDADHDNKGSNGAVKVGEAEITAIRGELLELGLQDKEQKFLEVVGCNRIEDMTKPQYQKALSILDAKRKKVSK